jgi:hypothetical protein
VSTEPSPPRPTSGTSIEEITVTGVAPLLGSSMNVDKVSNTASILSSQDLLRQETSSLTGALDSQVVC